MSDPYVHGYAPRENERLQDQASALQELIHQGTTYPPGSLVLEAGCGVGAQTLTLARRSPQAQFVSIDVSAASVAQAQRALEQAQLHNVRCEQADLMHPRWPAASFDHVFVCFVLEHLPQPAQALQQLCRLLKPGGTLTAVEGDHGLVCFHPDSLAARRVVECQVQLQQRAGGNACIGRQLHPLLSASGLQQLRAQPRMVYVDGSRPVLADSFTRRTFSAMVEGVREDALRAGLIDGQSFDQGVRDLLRTSEADGVFCYTFFKAVGVRA
jgi:SAM-dependent methyltransferase